jgi:hypothetical protein
MDHSSIAPAGDEPRREFFNPLGTNGRDCPICFRTGTLTGTRGEGLELICLRGCGSGFRYRVAGHLFGPQLERIRLELYGPKRCDCGALHGRAGQLCSVRERS